MRSSAPLCFQLAAFSAFALGGAATGSARAADHQLVLDQIAQRASEPPGEPASPLPIVVQGEDRDANRLEQELVEQGQRVVSIVPESECVLIVSPVPDGWRITRSPACPFVSWAPPPSPPYEPPPPRLGPYAPHYGQAVRTGLFTSAVGAVVFLGGMSITYVASRDCPDCMEPPMVPFVLGLTGIPISMAGASIVVLAVTADAIDDRPKRPDPSVEVTYRF